MKIVDLYIIRKFLTTFFYMMAVIMAIAVVFDVSEKIDDFLEKDAPLNEIIIDYYLNFVLYYSNLFSALLIFIAVVFFTSKLASNTEIVAILSSGVSFSRFLFPYFVAATFLVAGSYYLNHWLIPKANKDRLAFENTYIRIPIRNWDQNIHKQLAPGERVYFKRYNNFKEVGYNFTLERWNDNKMYYKIVADYIVWDSVNTQWKIKNYHIRTIDGVNETITKGHVLDTTLNIHPDDFDFRLEWVEAMNTDELKEYIKEEENKGSVYVPYYKIELHQRSAYPFATYVLTLIGASIASRKVRGGIGLHIAVGLLVCVTYILAMKVTTVYATNAGLDPQIAVWLPNVLFGIGSLYIFRNAHR